MQDADAFLTCFLNPWALQKSCYSQSYLNKPCLHYWIALS